MISKLRMLFCLMLFFSICWLGVQRAAVCRQKPKLLLHLADSLAVLQSEICSRRSPLPSALCRCAELFEDTKTFYSMLLYGMKAGRPFSEIWGTAVRQLPQLSGEERHYLRALGEQLGCYDVHTQEEAFAVSIASLRNCAVQLSESSKVKAQLTVEVGAAVGLLLAIVCY